jgi:hypothetical protein
MSELASENPYTFVQDALPSLFESDSLKDREGAYYSALYLSQDQNLEGSPIAKDLLFWAGVVLSSKEIEEDRETWEPPEVESFKTKVGLEIGHRVLNLRFISKTVDSLAIGNGLACLAATKATQNEDTTLDQSMADFSKAFDGRGPIVKRHIRETALKNCISYLDQRPQMNYSSEVGLKAAKNVQKRYSFHPLSSLSRGIDKLRTPNKPISV